MRNTFINCLIKQAENDKRIFLITPDMGFSVLEAFREKFPDRFLNSGIAEQNTIGVAAGLALSGKIVYVYSIIPFVTMRCFEQVRVDLAYMNTNVRIVGVGAGYGYGPAGSTHHAIEDIAIMRALPNMTVCCPGDPIEVRELINASFDHYGPIYFRLGKNGDPQIHKTDIKIRLGDIVCINSGKDAYLLATSTMLIQAKRWVKEWEDEGFLVSLFSIPTIKPIDKEAIFGIFSKNKPIVLLEEHNAALIIGQRR